MSDRPGERPKDDGGGSAGGGPQPIEIPRALSDRFRVEDRIGQGGFGTVYRVFEPATGDVYALKVIKLEGGFGRARREIKAALKVQHPRVIRCYEADILEKTYAYFLFELADGSLKQLMRYKKTHDRAWDVLCDACEGVGALHAAGLVHRDLKPSNILIGDEGGKVADLGLVDTDDAGVLKRRRQVIGTPQYMSPEQARGEDTTPAADVYALAVMAYVCLEGRLPYRGKDAAALLRQVSAGGWRPFEVAKTWVSPKLLGLVERGLARDPAQRPRDVARWGRRLRKYKPDFRKRPRGRGGEDTGIGEVLREALGDLGEPGNAVWIAGVIALGMAIGWWASAPAPFAAAPPPPAPLAPPAASAGAAGSAAGRLAAVTRRVSTDPVIRDAVGLTGLTATPEVLSRWRAGRRRLRQLARTEDLRRLIGGLADAPPTPETVSRVTRLALVTDLLSIREDPGDGPVFAPGEGPDFAAVMARARRVEVTALPPQRAGALEAFAAAFPAPGDPGGGPYTVIHRAAGLDRFMLVKNFDWVAFRDPRPEIVGLMAEVVADRRGVPPRRGELAAKLPRGGGGDLELAFLLDGWAPTRRALLELVGAEGSVSLLVAVPEAPGREDGRRGRLGLKVRVAAAALPADCRTMRLGARGLQPLTAPGARVGVREVRARYVPAAG